MKPPRRKQSFGRDGNVPSIYKEMLSDERCSEIMDMNADMRPLKRRRIAQPQRAEKLDRNRHLVQDLVDSHSQTAQGARTWQSTTDDDYMDDQDISDRRTLQTVVDLEDSDESDMEWENALDDSDDGDDEESRDVPQISDISIQIGKKESAEMKSAKKTRKRAITQVEKRRRLDIHKMHVLCLLYHVHRRNTWCNDRKVQSTIRKIVPLKILSNLVPDPSITQYSASKRFVDSMNELKMLWSKRFRITARGMHKPRWVEADTESRPSSDFDEYDNPMDKDEFRNAACTLQGSQDIGTQLFCALLRGIGIEARLVCSLQPLPFASAAERANPLKLDIQENTIVVDPFSKPSGPSSSRLKAQAQCPKKLSRLERIMGERHAILNQTGRALESQRAHRMPFPIYWVEVFNLARQSWVSIDTHSTFTVNSPEKLEPPLGLSQNSLCYAIAFEEDLTAKDITRRYARSYNAKTRKLRVECSPSGDRWWKRTLGFFRRAALLDRDQIEDAALARKEAAEGMPKNMQDFKGHPIYVLERHLKHNEIIHPLTQIGRTNSGTAMNPRTEPIYRRSNVHVVRSSDKWYRMGRDIKEGEQPLKHAKLKKGRQISPNVDGEMDGQQDETGVGLYAEFQTELYIPPPVIKGRVPRNAYGNLDLYVPSMCPTGGTHIRHKLAAKAARIVGVDFADAVTGFSFKGRHGTAIVQGIVVASEYADAVRAVIDGMEYREEQARAAMQTSQSLRLWRRFLIGLRIAQRVNAIKIDGEEGPLINVQDEISKHDRDLAAREMAGGFFPAENDFTDLEPLQERHEALPSDHDDTHGGFTRDEDSHGYDHESESFITENNMFSGPKSFDRQHSFESSILASRTLLPRRRSSSDQANTSDGDGANKDILFDLSPEANSRPAAGGGQGQPPSPTTNTTITEHPVHLEQEEIEPFILEEAATRKEAIAVHDHSVPEQSVNTKVGEQHKPPSSSPSDPGSLLLEDPDDEDADPDWLVDAT